MTKNGSNDLKKRARALAETAGIGYQEALTSLRTPRTSPAPVPDGRGFVLSPEVERFIDGEGQIGVTYDLREFLAERTAKPYECHHCGQDANTATTATSVQFTVSVFDPDLNPVTYVMMSQFAHASCTESVIRWAVPAEIPQQPRRISLAVPDDPDEQSVTYTLTATAHLAPPAEPGGPQLPVLLFTAEPEDYEPDPVLCHLLDYHLAEDGFPREGSGELGEHGWSLRLEHGADTSESWIAVRTVTQEPDSDQGHGHFFLGAIDLTDAWAALARERGEVLLLAGPIGPHPHTGDLTLPAPDGNVLELLDDDVVRGGWCPLDAPDGGHQRPRGGVRAR
ncbi:hypothetical protein [Streptomyces melanogenes]|uniref:hypothetical protein n=1 Tax=Streptomyces melanogenes TaxID=67326 RepID=UPI00167EC080|nr:hypothetical protein [Streptomyces melanogenes]GGP78485.1 hypothetical protein GCM10010278_66170 [Streptomyces melanogenes]